MDSIESTSPEKQLTIDEYIAAILPLIKLTKKYKASDSYAAHTLHYLYRQAFYGFHDFGKKSVSKEAKKEYEKLGYSDSITSKTVNDQTSFEPSGRRSDTGGAIFHLEHVLTGTMFRKMIDDIPDDELSDEAIKKIIKEHYHTAWITKIENKRLDMNGYKSERPNDPLEAYSNVNIELMDE